MSTHISVNVHYKPGDIKHHWFPGSGTCKSYGTLQFGKRDLSSVIVFLDNPAEVDAVIAELVALRAEMEPPAPDPVRRYYPCCEHCGDRCNAAVGNGHQVECPDCAGNAILAESIRTGQPLLVTEDEPQACECRHGQDEHADAVQTPCQRPGCGCTVFRLRAPERLCSCGHPLGTCGITGCVECECEAFRPAESAVSA